MEKRELVSSSHREYVYDNEEKWCFCPTPKRAPRETSWSDQNPGRRFYACPDYRVGGCGFFEWYDKAFNPRVNEILLELRDSERYFAYQNDALLRGKYCNRMLKERTELQRISNSMADSSNSIADNTGGNNGKGSDEDDRFGLKVKARKIKKLKETIKYGRKEKNIYMICFFLSIAYIVVLKMGLSLG